MFETQAAATAACTDGRPPALWRRLNRARVLFARAGRAKGEPRALIRKALLMVDRADQIRYRSAARGTITPDCSAAIVRIVRRIQGGAARWEMELAPPG